MAYSIKDLENVVAISEEQANAVAKSPYLSRAVTNSYKVIPVPKDIPKETQRAIHRMNCLGSLYYFATVVLNKNKFQKNPDPARNLHLLMCKTVEKDGLQEVIEIPRDHFKSSVYSECNPMWRVLPFTEADEILFRKIGYSDEFILWMKRAHRQNYRWLLVSEVTLNAQKLGTKIAFHYESNEVFKHFFPEIIPDKSCTWNADSLHHKRTAGATDGGEGTFDFIGVGGALQSRHYDGMVQDDLIGRAAFESPSILEATIEYHQLLVGAMDAEVDGSGRENDEIIVGNRWAYNDLNSYIRTNENYFNFTTHSALGGCCKLHPYGTPIFPEAFTLEKLDRFKRRLGNYLFSCQFLNTPINPAEVKFKVSDLRYYEFVKDEEGSVTTDKKRRVKIRHHVHEGDVIADVYPRNLKRYMIVDPNHSGNEGRCRHAITVTGVHENPRREYLLDVWAKACGIDEFISVMLHLAVDVWKLDEIYLETIAAQKYLKYHLDTKIASSTDPKLKNLKIKELKTPKTKNAKKMRIDGLGPIFERHEFWVNTYGQNEFLDEIKEYPNGQLRDVLDTLGYGPQVWEFDPDTEDIEESILTRRYRYERNTARRHD